MYFSQSSEKLIQTGRRGLQSYLPMKRIGESELLNDFSEKTYRCFNSCVYSLSKLMGFVFYLLSSFVNWSFSHVMGQEILLAYRGGSTARLWGVRGRVLLSFHVKSCLTNGLL